MQPTVSSTIKENLVAFAKKKKGPSSQDYQESAEGDVSYKLCHLNWVASVQVGRKGVDRDTHAFDDHD